MADRKYGYDPVGTGAPVNQQAYRMEAGQEWRQYIIAGVANIAIIATGYSMGWTSPINLKLKSNDTSVNPLPSAITDDQESWVGSLLTVGAIFGPFLGGLASSAIGRKWGLLSAIIPSLIGWILVAAATNVGLIYAGRILWGISTGMIFTISPMYCAEIATDNARGALGSFIQMFITVGFLLVYIIGPYVTYSVTTYFGVALVACFAITFFFMPESPVYHLGKNNRDAAAESLAKIRGRSIAGVQSELDKLAANVENATSKKAHVSDLFKGANFKAFYMCCALLFFQQFTGINAVLFYLTNIFEAAGSDLDSSVATIIIGAVQLIASSMTPLVVDRLGRRILLMISSCGTALGLILLGMFFIIDHLNPEMSKTVGFLPLLSLILFIITYCWGLGPLPWAVVGEMMPIEVKAVASPIATAFCWILSFLVTRFFGPIGNAVGLYTVFWIFGICCVCSFFFSLLVLPETKGKSFQEIQDMLSGRSSSKPQKA